MGFFAALLISTLISLTISVVASFLIPSTSTHQDNAKASAFSDFQFPQSEEGTPQCVIFGDAWTVDWMVLWVGDYASQPVKSSELSATGPDYKTAIHLYGGASSIGGTAGSIPSYNITQAIG